MFQSTPLGPTSQLEAASVRAQFGDRIRIPGMDGAEEFLGLTVKLFEVGPDGQAADGHDEPPSMSPWSAGVGQGGSAITSERLAICSGGLSPVRGREAPSE